MNAPTTFPPYVADAYGNGEPPAVQPDAPLYNWFEGDHWVVIGTVDEVKFWQRAGVFPADLRREPVGGAA